MSVATPPETVTFARRPWVRLTTPVSGAGTTMHVLPAPMVTRSGHVSLLTVIRRSARLVVTSIGVRAFRVEMCSGSIGFDTSTSRSRPSRRTGAKLLPEKAYRDGARIHAEPTSGSRICGLRFSRPLRGVRVDRVDLSLKPQRLERALQTDRDLAGGWSPRSSRYLPRSSAPPEPHVRRCGPTRPPTAVLLIYSVWLEPIYYPRYLCYTSPGMALR